MERDVHIQYMIYGLYMYIIYILSDGLSADGTSRMAEIQKKSPSGNSPSSAVSFVGPGFGLDRYS